MRCPVCETENGEDAAECATCGHVLMLEGELEPEVEVVPGLEETIRSAPDDAPVEFLPDVERTQLVDGELPYVPDRSVEVEHTRIEEDPNAPLFWSPGAVELESGREQDDGQRTAAPVETGACPWCGAETTAAVCDSCGRRRSRYTRAAPVAEVAASGELVLCPACFAKVPEGPRCVECGVPFAVTEL